MPATHRSRNAWIVAASLAVHVAVLAVLALHAPRLRIPVSEPGPPEAIIPVLIMPRAPPPAAAPGAKPAEIRLHRRPQRFALEPLPIKPLVAPVEEPTPGRPSQAPGPRVLTLPGQEEALAANARKALRSRANCDDPNLTRAEREACQERFAKGAKDAPFLGLGVEREKARGLEAAAARREADYNYKRGGVPPGTCGGTSATAMGACMGNDRPALKVPF